MRRNAINMPFGKLKRNSNEKKCYQYAIRKLKRNSNEKKCYQYAIRKIKKKLK